MPLNMNTVATEYSTNNHADNIKSFSNFNYNKIRNRGFVDAGHVDGNPSAFRISIERLYNRVMLKHGFKKVENEDNYQLRVKRNQQLNKEIETKYSMIDKIRNQRIPDIDRRIDEKKSELREIKQNHQEDYNIKKDKLNLFVLGFVWLLLGVYLLIFYSSAIYSAFFRDFKAYKTTLFNSILYPTTISEALNSGETVFLMVILGPFVFLGISIVLHKSLSDFHLTKNKVIFIAISVFILFFDFILAYHISEKIYNAESLISFESQESYSVSKAIVNSNFWLIIMFGLVAYVIWGLIYYYFDSERAVSNKLKKIKNNIDSEINDLQQQKNELYKELDILENSIYSLQLELSNINTERDIISINKNALTRVLSEYTIGWIQYLSRAGFGSIIKEVEDIYKYYMDSKDSELENDKIIKT